MGSWASKELGDNVWDRDTASSSLPTGFGCGKLTQGWGLFTLLHPPSILVSRCWVFLGYNLANFSTISRTAAFTVAWLGMVVHMVDREEVRLGSLGKWAEQQDKFSILGAAGMVLGLVLQLERILVGSSGSRKV